MRPAIPTPEFLALQEAVAGRFSLARELGRGGMGVVFLARDLSLDRPVAIKLLPPAFARDAGARERFLREARTAAGLAHPHIVPIHSVEDRDGLAFFVMGYIEGETLGERVRRAGPLASAEWQRLVQEVAWALAHAHARGVIHRDVKPDNILIETGSGRALVTDFGIALGLDSPTRSDGAVRGTPQYVSPEVAQGAIADARSDIYSLGVTAWVAATGRLPFGGESPAALLLAHVQSVPPPLASAAPGLAPRLTSAIDRCLAKDPGARWPSLDALAAEFDAVRARPPLVPAPQRAFLREWERIGSEVATTGVAAAVAFADAAGLAVFDLLFVRPGANSILVWIFLLLGVLASGLAKARLLQAMGHARELARRGVDHRRLIAAMGRDGALRAEERAAIDGDEVGRRGRDRWILAGTIAGGALCFPMAMANGPAVVNLLGIAGAVVLPTLAIRHAMRLLAPGRREGWWTRVLRGAFGRWMFRPRSGAAAPTAGAAFEADEPTVIAVGSAARALHAALSADLRRQLGPGIPDLIDALEAKAMAARDLAELRGGNAGAVEALGALESLRLDLLRLSVGTMTAPQLTAELERVRDLGFAVDRQLEARDVVEDLLAGERTPT